MEVTMTNKSINILVTNVCSCSLPNYISYGICMVVRKDRIVFPLAPVPCSLLLPVSIDTARPQIANTCR